MYTTHRMGRDGHCQQFDTTPTLISAPHWPHRPCNAPMQLYRVGKKPSVKADLATYSYTANVSRRCMSVSLILGCELDFSSCAIRMGFRKSSHIWCSTHAISHYSTRIILQWHATHCKPLILFKTQFKTLVILFWMSLIFCLSVLYICMLANYSCRYFDCVSVYIDSILNIIHSNIP